ncbi:MAG: glycogen synthase GlgA [Methylococcaceae bacterium]|jgi:starch synthase|nr:glycogen synthase GlgA [Methylococcaceae bacterium]MDD1630799.1 glycogen synthase GlgA [Methylococcaceae bacterium]MDD1636784.1 glycogen synthase GlgA [Methylococcaceae bacterium]OYV20627.1 MAG: glycogen synthase [Methylococcaceae bacterium NSM2-1]
MKKILFVTSEAHPLIKTGGLADVCGSLPKALADLSQDIKLIIPNYQALKTSENVRFLCSIRVDNRNINILETRMPDSHVIVWLVDYPAYYNYPGNPYVDEQGESWPNNAERFGLFCRIAVEAAMDRVHQDWKPDIVHCNDWQTGLVPALLSLEHGRPSTVFTIHNMAYQGLFPGSTAAVLNLPGKLWHPAGLEFHDMLSFIKGGLVYADYITTVSPTYALEIQTPELGYGLEGLLDHRKEFLGGIINGIDLDQWNPETDPYITQHFSAATLNKKQLNKYELQRRFSLPDNERIPLFGLIGRLVEQKGIDLILECLPEMITMDMQFVLLGSGDKDFEKQLQKLAHLYPDKISITIGYDESLAHLIEAGADIFLMPSRFEPCGLNQMYSQRYGTIPIVRKTGGLADTVVDTLPETLANHTASGIVFNEASSGSLLEAIKRAMILYSSPDTWKKMQSNAMKKDFSWQSSAEQYLALYENL